MEAIKAPHFAYSLYKKPEHELNVIKKTVPTTRQTMTRPFCSNLIKALLNQHLLCQVTHPPLKASVSSITDYSHRGSGNLELQTELQEALLLSDKKTSPGASLQGRTILPTLEYWNSNLYISTNISTPITKRWFWLLWHYIKFCHVHKWWCVTLWLLCVILWN